MPRRPRDLALSIAMASFFVGLVVTAVAFALYASDQNPPALLIIGGLALMGVALVSGIGRTTQLGRRRDGARDAARDTGARGDEPDAGAPAS